MTFSKFQFFKS